MKQYTTRMTDTISCDIERKMPPFFRRMLTNENVKTYMHKNVDEDMKKMKKR